MMLRSLPALSLALLLCAACSSREGETLRYWPADNSNGIVAGSPAVYDDVTSIDDGGSLRVEAQQAMTVPLYESGNLDVESAILVYEAAVRSNDLSGQAYLEMWCVFPDGTRYFSRGLTEAISGTTDWTRVKTPFRLEPGQNPVDVELNIVVDGTGTVWIDDLRLKRVPL